MRIAISIFITSLLYWGSAYGQHTYPEWFIHPQQYPDYYMGYSFRGTQAVTDAEITYCVYHECVVDGELQIYDIESEQDLLKSSNYYYNYSPDSLQKIQGRLKLVDGKMVTVFPTEYIELFALDSIPDDFQSKEIDVYTLQKPAWTEKDVWQDNIYYYGVGEFTSRGSHNDAWKTAEEHAIFKILSAIAMGTYKINVNTQSETEEDMEIIKIFKVKYLLRNIEILERYPDQENEVFMALARIPIKDIVSPMMR
jgi:hypothetical protein